MIYQSNTFLSRLLPLFLLLCGLHTSAHAQPNAPVAGLTDHSLITRFPDSVIIERELQRDINYRIVLGGLERIRGEVIPEDSKRLRGDVTKITYEVTQEFTSQDVSQFFREQLQNKNYEVLFSCQGRGCGSSNYWANDIFRNRILYGPESNQYYVAFRANSGLENDPYFSLYIITRVNRNIYAHIEIIEPGGSQEPAHIVVSTQTRSATNSTGTAVNANLLQQLTQQGSVVLPDIVFGANDSVSEPVDLAPIVTVLNADPSLMVYLVAHLKAEGQSLEELMRRSTLRANSVRQALITAGVDAERIEAAGVGPLAPNCASGDCEERVELVLR